MTSHHRALSMCVILGLTLLATGCDPRVDEEAAAPPDTIIRQAGSEAARDACRNLVRDQLGVPRERIYIQEDALVRSRGEGRFQTDGLARVEPEDTTRAQQLHRFDCTVRYLVGVGWSKEDLQIRRVRDDAGEGDAGAGAEAAGGE